MSILKNLIGIKFGRLFVIDYVGKNKHGQHLWKCLCDCGKEYIVLGCNLKKGTKSCGCWSREITSERCLIDLTGKRFNRLLVIRRDNESKQRHVKWICRCDCGKERSVDGSNLKSGATQSCRCLNQELKSQRSGDKSPMKRPEIRAKFMGDLSPTRRPEVRAKMSKSQLALGDNHPMKRPEVRAKVSGSKNHNWCGGTSFGKYCPKFNPEFKNRVRAFFNYECIMCGKTTEENGKQLDVHHVDYNKEACCDGKEVQFVTLCKSCHGKTNHERDKWQDIFRIIIYYLYNNKSYFTKDEYSNINN